MILYDMVVQRFLSEFAHDVPCWGDGPDVFCEDDDELLLDTTVTKSNNGDTQNYTQVRRKRSNFCTIHE